MEDSLGKSEVAWEKKPAAEDLEAARTYLNMVLDKRAIERAIRNFRRCSTLMLEAKDVLRASGLSLLEKNDPKVSKDIKRLGKRKKLSPVLLIKGNIRTGIPMTIADGYHRVCASYYWDENCLIACCFAT